MERWHLVTVIVAAYLALTLGIGLSAARKSSKGVQGFVAGDRSFGLLVMYFVTGATVFSAFAFLGGPGWAYSRGAAAFYILSYGVLGMSYWYWLGPKAARVGRRFGYVTQGQLLAGRFPSRTLSVVVALIGVLAFIPYVTLQMRGAAIVIEAVTEGHVPIWLGALVAYGVVVLYVITSGVAAVGWTNTFQGIVMVVIAWTLGLYLPYKLYGGVGAMFEQIATERPELLAVPGLRADGTAWTWGAYSSAILVSAVGLNMWPHLFMKAFAAKSVRTLRRTIVLFPTFQLFLIPVMLIGFAGVLFPTAPPSADFILPFMILETGMPAVVVGLFCAGALSASMSTGDALLHAAGSITVEDGVSHFVEMSEDARTRLMKVVIVLVAVIAYYFAVTGNESLVVLLLTSYGIICQLAPPVIAALYWPRATTAGAHAGLLAGAATAVFFYAAPDLRPFDVHEGLMGLLVHVPVLVIVSLATRDQGSEGAMEFVRPQTGDGSEG